MVFSKKKGLHTDTLRRIKHNLCVLLKSIQMFKIVGPYSENYFIFHGRDNENDVNCHNKLILRETIPVTIGSCEDFSFSFSWTQPVLRRRLLMTCPNFNLVWQLTSLCKQRKHSFQDITYPQVYQYPQHSNESTNNITFHNHLMLYYLV